LHRSSLRFTEIHPAFADIMSTAEVLWRKGENIQRNSLVL